MTVKLYDRYRPCRASVRPGRPGWKSWGCGGWKICCTGFQGTMRTRQRLYTVASAPAGEKCCVAAEITEPPRTSRTRTGMEMTRFRAADDTGFLTLTFFHQSYVRSALRPGQRYLFYGPVEGAGPRKTMVNPLFDREGTGHQTGRIVPVYRRTEGISNALLAGAVERGLTDCVDQIPEDLPPGVRSRYHLAQAGWAVRSVHFPASWEELELARRRLVLRNCSTSPPDWSCCARDGFRRRVLPA